MTLAVADFLFRLANRLGQVPVGSPAADRTIHDALGLAGPVLPYTCEEAAARSLLPVGWEWIDTSYSARAIYAACRRGGMDGEQLHLHFGSWGATLPLAMCGAVVRASAALAGSANRRV